MKTYAATFESGATWTRNSNRPFTHAILIIDSIHGNLPVVYWASSAKLAESKGKAETCGQYTAFQTYEVAEAHEVAEDFIAS